MRNLTLLGFLAVLLVLPIVAYGYTGGAGLYDSPHDFVKPSHANEMGIVAGIAADGSPVGGTTATEPGAVGLCNFCHTPHRAIQTSLLWNHTLSADTAQYTWNDVTTTVGGTTLPTNIRAWAGPTRLCLSCHDGTVAIGDLNWYQGASRIGTSDKLSGRGSRPGYETDLLTRAGLMGKYNIADGITAGSMNGNHPVAIPYPYGGVANTYNNITTGDDVVGVGLTAEWISDPRGKGIRLYQQISSTEVRGFTGTSSLVGSGVGIECGSCHDVHNGPTVKPDTVTNRPRLVRGTVYGDGTGGTTAFAGGDDDYLCVKCHKK